MSQQVGRIPALLINPFNISETWRNCVAETRRENQAVVDMMSYFVDSEYFGHRYSAKVLVSFECRSGTRMQVRPDDNKQRENVSRTLDYLLLEYFMSVC